MAKAKKKPAPQAELPPLSKDRLNMLSRNDLPEEDRKELQRVKGMISGGERLVLYNVAKHLFQNAGLIIDAGSFVGSSTVSLALGLHRNEEIDQKDKSKRIKSYDLFRVWTDLALPYLNDTYQVGDNFFQFYEEQIKDYTKYVEIFNGDLLAQTTPDELVEILFLDVCKSWDLERKTRQIFFNKLVKGSLIIQQDFFASGSPWIVIALYLLRDHIEHITNVDTTAIFSVKNSIPPELCDYDLKKHNMKDLIGMLEQGILLYGKQNALPLVLSQAQLHYEFKGKDEAISYLIHCCRKYNLDHRNKTLIRAFRSIGHWDKV